MTNQKKVKLLIGFAIFITIALIGIIVFQVTKNIQNNLKYKHNQNQIELLEKEREYYEYKLPDTNYEIII